VYQNPRASVFLFANSCSDTPWSQWFPWGMVGSSASDYLAEACCALEQLGSCLDEGYSHSRLSSKSASLPLILFSGFSFLAGS
jgi:hypothetical protein